MCARSKTVIKRIIKNDNLLSELCTTSHSRTSTSLEAGTEGCEEWDSLSTLFIAAVAGGLSLGIFV